MRTILAAVHAEHLVAITTDDAMETAWAVAQYGAVACCVAYGHVFRQWVVGVHGPGALPIVLRRRMDRLLEAAHGVGLRAETRRRLEVCFFVAAHGP